MAEEQCSQCVATRTISSVWYMLLLYTCLSHHRVSLNFANDPCLKLSPYCFRYFWYTYLHLTEGISTFFSPLLLLLSFFFEVLIICKTRLLPLIRIRGLNHRMWINSIKSIGFSSTSVVCDKSFFCHNLHTFVCLQSSPRFARLFLSSFPYVILCWFNLPKKSVQWKKFLQ